jgi:hypothetical protein
VWQGYVLTLPAGAWLLLTERVFRGRPDGRSSTARFLRWAALGFLVYSIFFNSKLPRPLDWDLFAPAALPVALFAANGLAGALEAGRASLALATFAVLLSLAVTVPWILSNT